MSDQRKEFGKIYDKYIEKIYRFVFLKVNCKETAQDICSDTFLRGWENFKRVEFKIENPQAFLYTIARNLVTDHYRQKGRIKMISPENVPITDPSQNLEEKAMINSEVDQVKAVLADLRDDYQNVIIWHYLEDLPITEVAKMMEKSEEATRVTLHRALKTLKNNCNKKEISSSLLYDNASRPIFRSTPGIKES